MRHGGNPGKFSMTMFISAESKGRTAVWSGARGVWVSTNAISAATPGSTELQEY